MEIELAERGIPFVSKQELPVYYKGKPLKKNYIVDFVCFEKVIVEIKALDRLSNREVAQLIHYLKCTGLEVGLLINFGIEKLDWQRKVLTNKLHKN